VIAKSVFYAKFQLWIIYT